MQPFRVLSFDGGGSWALIQVKALIALYGSDAGGHQVLSHFDLAAANSGGSIVLGCLIEDFSLQQILDFFNNEGQRKAVFSNTTSAADRVLNDLIGIGPKYSAENKLPALQHVLARRGNMTLPEAVADIPGAQGSLHALIVAFDYDRNRAAFFRSRTVQGPSWGCGAKAEVTLAEAIHASTNAPVNYFDGPAIFPDRGGRYWDGAITGCNNPVLAAVTEAIGLGQDPHNIVALSIGTANNVLPWGQANDPPSLYTQPVPEASLKTDIKKLASSVLDDPPDAATFVAHVMTGCGAGLDPAVSGSRIVRMNPLVAPRRAPAGAADPWCPPAGLTAAQFKYIFSLDMDAVETAQVFAVSYFADLWVNDQVLNQPIRMDADTLKCELGQDTFSAALEAWRKISAAAPAPPAPSTASTADVGTR
jgi:hypothetical protein